MFPPLSQVKAAARKGKQVEVEIATQIGASSKSIRKNDKVVPKKPGRKRAPPQPREMDMSVTISVGSDDIDVQLLEKVQQFINKECISGLCSIERGGALSRLHLQMVCRLVTTSAAVVSKLIKTYLGWDDAKKAPVGHHILTKILRNTGLHTFVGMLGYCIKDKGEDHFQCVHKNVTPEQIEEGVEEYIKYGTPFAKNRIVLTHSNLIERAATYCRYKMKKHLGSSLPGTLLPMLRSGQFIPSASWVLSARQGGMEYNRAAALWKCMINPDAIEMDDVTQIFFQHTNPGSRLADLGRQRLATSLNEAREGAEHDYDVLDDVPKQVPDNNDVIIIEGSQADLHHNPTTKPMPLASTAEAAPAYIPVVYGDPDLESSFLL